MNEEGGAGLGISLAAVALIGLLINLYILVVVLLTRQVEGGGRVLLGHLGLIGVLVCCLVLVSSAPALLLIPPSRTTFLPCPLHGFLFTLLHPLSLWTLCGLNCDRYWAIASPLHYATLVRPRKVLLCLGITWTLSLALCLPPLFLIPYTYSPALASCTPDYTAPGAAWYAALYTAFTLLLPAAVIMACNLKVLMIARYHRHRIARAIFEVTLSAQVTITHQKNPFLVTGSGGFFQGRSAAASVLQLVGSLLVLYLPYYSAVMWQSAGRPPSQPLLTLASSLLACSPSLNGLLYGLRSKLLRRTVRHYWRKKMTKSELDQEIQARTPSRRPSLTPQRVWRPVSTSALGLSPRAPSLRHSATSTSILARRSDPPRTKPRILVTRASSEERHTPARIRLKIGGSSSSMSGESDVTQEEDREWRWLGASSASLPEPATTQP